MTISVADTQNFFKECVSKLTEGFIMKTLKFSRQDGPPLTLKELVEGGQKLFFGENIPNFRNTDIDNAYRAAIMIKRFSELQQFANNPALIEKVRELSEEMKNVLSKYENSEAKDINNDDLNSLSGIVKELPTITVTKDNTTDLSVMALNAIAQAIEAVKNATNDLVGAQVISKYKPTKTNRPS